MGIVPVHEWKVPLKYWGMFPFPSESLGLGQVADTMVWGRTSRRARAHLHLLGGKGYIDKNVPATTESTL